jgi:phosphohistidine phosphatase
MARVDRLGHAMPRQLWLLRHGDAEPHGTREDAARQLTERGERQSVLAGRALAGIGVEFETIYTSPRVRALDTARLACESLGLEPQVHEPLSGEFGREDADAVLAAASADARVLLVGHEPDFSQLVYDFTGARTDIKKGGIAAIRLDGPAAELIALLRPREIELLASGS